MKLHMPWQTVYRSGCLWRVPRLNPRRARTGRVPLDALPILSNS
jgi:hypothetical protein